MKEVHNATEFRGRLDEHFARAVRIPDLAGPQAGTPGEREAWLERRDWLEHHARDYVIDHILLALNWRICPVKERPWAGTNLAAEVPVRGDESERRRYLDYLGYDAATQEPLMIVEAKRPALELPISEPLSDPRSHPLGRALVEYLREENGREPDPHGGASDGLNQEWRAYLADLHDYVGRVAQSRSTPCRVVLTNGNWLIIFENPQAAFGSGAANGCAQPVVSVYADRDSIRNHYDRIFASLNYHQLSRQVRGVRPSEIGSVVDPREVDGYLYGLKVLYFRQPGLFQTSPQIHVAPVLLLRSAKKSFLRVEPPAREFVIPTGPRKLSEHLCAVDDAAHALLCDTLAALGGHPLAVTSLQSHYTDADSFASHPGVVRVVASRSNSAEVEMVLVTGDRTHFLTPDPAFDACPYHKHAAASANGVAARADPFGRPSIAPPSYFEDANAMHCAHRDVYSPKRQPVTPTNRARCGSRSGSDGDAFCELWAIENFLCCRGCVFVCTCLKAGAFRVPCTPPANPAGSASC